MRTAGPQPEVSIVLPCHNVARYVDEAVASVQAQTWANWELLAVDDGSQDGTARRLDHWRSVLGDRMGVQTNARPRGAAKARNQAIAASRGRFVAFLDADDVWRPEKLSEQIPGMTQRGLALSFTGYRKIDADSRPGPTYVSPPSQLSIHDFLTSNPVKCCSAVFDTHVLGKMFMRDVRMRNDLLLWIDILNSLANLERGRDAPMQENLHHVSAQVGGIDRELVAYREYATSLSGNKLRAARYQWRTYREELHLSLLQSAQYFCRYAIKGSRRFLVY